MARTRTRMFEQRIKLSRAEIAEREALLVEVVREEQEAEAAAKESAAEHREILKGIRTRKRKLAEEAATGEAVQRLEHDPRQAGLFGQDDDKEIESKNSRT